MTLGEPATGAPGDVVGRAAANYRLNLEEIRQGRVRLSSYPPNLQIDLIGRCNMAPPCPMCPSTRHLPTPMRHDHGWAARAGTVPGPLPADHWRLEAHEGTFANRVHGVHELEIGPAQGLSYRWTSAMARLVLPTPGPGRYTFGITARSGSPGGASAHLEVRIDDVPTGSFDVAGDAWRTYRIPFATAGAAPVAVEIHCPAAFQPRALGCRTTSASSV